MFRHTYVAYTLFNGDVCNKRCPLKRQGREGKSRTGSSLLLRLFLLWVTGIRLVNGYMYDKLPNGDGLIETPCSFCPNGWSNTGTDTGTTLRQVLINWEGGKTDLVVTKYGPIEQWDVSEVTHMGSVFYERNTFNADISAWNVSQVTTLYGTFQHTDAFNSDISNWNVSNVVDLGNTFKDASAFNADLSKWNTVKVMTMKGSTSNFHHFVFLFDCFFHELCGSLTI